MQNDIDSLVKKIAEMKKGSVDLSRDEDLSIAIMNLISLEEHFYFTAIKTNNQKYLEMLDSIRKLRIEMLKKIVVNPEGEEWCISKHLLASSMRLIEVGTKELSKGNKDEANQFFKPAFDLYSLFFAINLKITDKEEIKSGKVESKSTLSKFSEIIKKIADCCKEG